jgi:hypothetical protein
MWTGENKQEVERWQPVQRSTCDEEEMREK